MADTLELTAALNRLGFVRATPRNRTIGGFGDSRIFLSWSGSGANDYLKTWGLMGWVQKFSNGACSAPVAYNGGVAGDTTAQMLVRQAAYIATLKAAGVNLVVVWGSTNDRPAGIDLGTSQRNLREIVRNFQIAGIDVILISETPRGNGSSSYELTAAQKADHYAMHVWIETVMSQMCAVANVWDYWVDPSSGTNYYPLASVVRDWIHPSKIGAMVAGRVVGKIVAAWCRGLPDLAESNVVFNATSNPKGSLTPNPLVAGTGGSIYASCAPVAGSVLADGWIAELTSGSISGLTTTWSKETLNGVSYQKLRIKGIATSSPAEVSAYLDVPLASLANNDKLKASGLVISQGVGLSAIGLNLMLVPGYTQKLDGDESDSSLPYPSENLGPLPFETPLLVFLTATGLTLVRLRLTVTVSPSRDVDCTVWFGKTGALKVTY